MPGRDRSAPKWAPTAPSGSATGTTSSSSTTPPPTRDPPAWTPSGERATPTSRPTATSNMAASTGSIPRLPGTTPTRLISPAPTCSGDSRRSARQWRKAGRSTRSPTFITSTPRLERAPLTSKPSRPPSPPTTLPSNAPRSAMRPSMAPLPRCSSRRAGLQPRNRAFFSTSCFPSPALALPKRSEKHWFIFSPMMPAPSSMTRSFTTLSRSRPGAMEGAS